MLETHPDLVDRLREIGAAASTSTTFGYLYGKAALVFEGGAIVAFAAGTHVPCVRVPRDDCDPELRYRPERYPRPPTRSPVLRAKECQLDRLVEGAWTRVDPWPQGLDREDGTHRLAALLDQAVELLIARRGSERAG